MNAQERRNRERILGTYGASTHILEKSERSKFDEIEKAGEGSRGGKVIGHTRSGLPIYENFNHPDHKNFTGNDHIDATLAHHKLGSVESGISQKEQKYHNKQAELHYTAASKTSTNTDKVLGMTQSGKLMHNSVDHADHKNFTSEDHAELAVAMKKEKDRVENKVEKADNDTGANQSDAGRAFVN